MAARRQGKRRFSGAALGTRKRRSFRAITEGLYELRVGARVVLDLLVTLDGELMTFIRIDGALLGEIPVMGEA